MLPIKKLYIDSRYKSPDSKSDSDFYINLPQNMLMPEGCGFYLDDISIPVAWYTIETNRNDHLYYRVNGTARIAVIPQGNYSLVDLNEAIVIQLNIAYANHFTSNPDIRKNTIGITINQLVAFEILTDAQLSGAGFTDPDPHSINDVLRNYTAAAYTQNFPYVSGYIDLFPIRNVYITSSGLGNFNTMSISGERAIVKKVPVTVGYGEVIHDQSLVGIDYLDCSKQTLSRIGFQLKDVFGRTLNLNGQHWSFSIVFSRVQEIM